MDIVAIDIIMKCEIEVLKGLSLIIDINAIVKEVTTSDVSGIFYGVIISTYHNRLILFVSHLFDKSLKQTTFCWKIYVRYCW